MQVRVKVKTNTRKEGVEEAKDGRLIVSVRAKAEDGKANARLITLLSRHFHVDEKRVHIIRGQTAPSKTVVVGE